MESLINSLANMNWQTIVSMFLVGWYFTKDIKSSLQSIVNELHVMNTRISRVEGTVYGEKLYKALDTKQEE